MLMRVFLIVFAGAGVWGEVGADVHVRFCACMPFLSFLAHKKSKILRHVEGPLKSLRTIQLKSAASK